MVITKTFETYEDALAFITAHEEEHGLRFVVWKVAKDFLGPLIGPISKKKMRYPTDEIPYLHLRNGSAYRSCSLGGREGAKHIKKPRKTLTSLTRKRKSTFENMDEEDKACPVCPAEVVIRSVTTFPGYEICKNWDKQHKQQVTDRLRKEFSHKTTVMQRLFIVQIDENHTAHRKKHQLRIDPRATEVITKLIERGYYSALDVSDMMKKEIAKMPDVTDPKHPRFNPGLDRIRKLTFSHVVRQRNLEREKGYTFDMFEPLQRMAELEQETNTSYLGDSNFDSFGMIDVYDVGRNKNIYTSSEADLRCKVSTDSVPFIVLQTKHFDCSHGVEYQNKFVIPFTPRQRKHMSKEGMVMCTARCTFKEIALFPGYRIDKDLQQKQVRAQILDRLREDLINRTAEYERVVAYAFPVGEEHCGHHVREANGHVYLDERIKTEITDLVQEGVRSLSEMRRHLKMYLKHNFDEVSMPGPFNKRYRPSNQTLMNLMYDAGLDPKEIVQDVGEPVEFISRPSLYKDISTRIEEKKKKFDASATMSLIAEAESFVETPYSTLIENMDVFQTIPTTPSKTGSKLDSSPLKAPPGATAAGNKDADGFSDLQFKKQSDCQALLEELLQSIYEMNDLFRLRDLNTHLRKLVNCVKAGQLLCDVIPLNRKRAARTSTTVTEVGNIGQDDDHKYTATPVNMETGIASTSTSEEPPTKIVIMDQDDKVTEVELPKDYDSSEIVIYQENDETGEQIYLVDKKMFAEEKGQQQQKQGEQQQQSEQQSRQQQQGERDEDESPVIPESNTTISAELNEKRQQYKEKAQRDMIKVKCKRYVPKEEIVRKLNVKMNPLKNLKKTPIKDKKSVDIQSNIKQEIRAQNAELKKYEKDKIKLAEIEMSYKQKATQPEKFVIDIENFEIDEIGPNKKLKTEHAYSDGRDEPTDLCSSESEDGMCEGEIVPNTKPNVNQAVARISQSVAECLSKKLASKVTNVNEGSSALIGNTGVSAQTKTPTFSNRSLTVGDTITFPPGGFNVNMNNQANTGPVINTAGITGGLIAINNIVYTNTPYGLVPAFGMPMVVNGQNRGIVIGNQAANPTVLGMAGNPTGVPITLNQNRVQTTINPSNAPTTPVKTSDASIQPTPSTPESASKKVTNDDDSNNLNEGENTTNVEPDANSNDKVGTSGKESRRVVNQASSSRNGSDSTKQPEIEGYDSSSAEQGSNKPKAVTMVNIPCVSLTPGMAIKKIEGSSSSKNALEKYVVLPAGSSSSNTGKVPNVAMQGKGQVESSVPNGKNVSSTTVSKIVENSADSAINNDNNSKVDVIISAKITEKNSDGGIEDGEEDMVITGDTEPSAEAIDEIFYAKKISHNSEGEIIITVTPRKLEDKNIKTKDGPKEMAQNLPDTNSIVKSTRNSVKKGVPLATESGDSNTNKPTTRDTACNTSEQVPANPNSARKGANNGTTLSSPVNPTKAGFGKDTSVAAVMRLVKQIHMTPNSSCKTVDAKGNIQAPKDKTPNEKKGVSTSEKMADNMDDAISKPNQMSAKKIPGRKKQVDVKDSQTRQSRKQEITVNKEGTLMTRSNKGQSPALMSNNDDVTNSGKMKTRGRQMRFSRGGEKLD